MWGTVTGIVRASLTTPQFGWGLFSNLKSTATLNEVGESECENIPQEAAICNVFRLIGR
jgi:hypothetical protein